MVNSQEMGLTDDMYAEYGALTKFAEEAIQALFRDKPSVAVEISARTKSKESIRKKVERKNSKNAENLNDISGVRIVCLSREEIREILEILTNEFDLIRHEKGGEDLGWDKMGYQDQKLIMKLGPKYSGAIHRRYCEKHFEIQIRTIFQNAWAVLSHVLVYKREEDAPSTIKRRINAISAACEILDDAAERIYSERKTYVDSVRSDLRQKPHGEMQRSLEQIPINFDTLAAYSAEKFPGKNANPSLQNLLMTALDRDRYKTIGDIDRVVRAAGEFLAWYSARQPELFHWSTDYLTKALGFRDGSFRQMHGFSPRTKQAFEEFSAPRRK